MSSSQPIARLEIFSSQSAPAPAGPCGQYQASRIHGIRTLTVPMSYADVNPHNEICVRMINEEDSFGDELIGVWLYVYTSPPSPNPTHPAYAIPANNHSAKAWAHDHVPYARGAAVTPPMPGRANYLVIWRRMWVMSGGVRVQHEYASTHFFQGYSSDLNSCGFGWGQVRSVDYDADGGRGVDGSCDGGDGDDGGKVDKGDKTAD